MLNGALYKREMKNSFKILAVFAVILSMYISIIISMFDPQMMEMMDGFYRIMPEVMEAVGMTPGETSLIGFMISYLYGFILLIFPMLFCILRGNGLIAKYTDQGSMVSLLAAPTKRSTVALTQVLVLLTGIFLLIVYTTVVEVAVVYILFPGEMLTTDLVKINASLFCLHTLIGGICFLFSCIFSDTKRSIAFGAGIPALMYILQMLANVGDRVEWLRYATVFTLFDATAMITGDGGGLIKTVILLFGAICLYAAGVLVFCRKDLHI
ncbi:MAG: ABC transporter permease [Eubacteriales bacterium]|nr:ABC transporter permease [Eubacteriales bacterium]